MAHPSALCTLATHAEAFSNLEVLVNPPRFPSWNIRPGIRLCVTAREPSSRDVRFPLPGTGDYSRGRIYRWELS